MKKFAFQAIALLVLISAALYVFISGTQFAGLPFMPQTSTAKQLTINNAKIKVEVADTPEKRSKGLSGKQALASDEGMLFVFPKADKYSFWMKGLNFSLDFVWIRENKVVEVYQNIQPPSPGQSEESLPIFQPREDVDKVLELNAGTVERLNIKAGDTVKIE